MAGMMITLIEVPAGDPTTVATAPRSLRSGRAAGTHQDRDGRHRRATDGPLRRLLDRQPGRPTRHPSPTEAR